MTAFTDCCAPGLSGTVSELMLVHSQDGIAQQVRNPPATEEWERLRERGEVDDRG